ncbi:MAG: hypothetical protein WB785_18815 [Mycobacterium sp.]|uniref:hypothetical protein n=1 Tax=Mycobacterium sp. TaxID=1785 RepID=UPI003C4E35D8
MTDHGSPRPPDDPSEAPTGQYDYSDYGPAPGSTPWYRRRAALIGLGVLAAILIALMIYGIVELTRSDSSTSPSTSPTTSAVTTTPSTTTSLPSSQTTTEPLVPAPTTSSPLHHHHHHDGGMP